MLSLLTQSIVVGSQIKYERSQFIEGNFLKVTNGTKPSVIKIFTTSVKGDLSDISFRQYSIRIGFKGEYLRYGSYYYVLIEKDYLVKYDYPIFKWYKPISEERFLEFLNYYRKPLNIVDFKIEYEDFQEFILQDGIDWKNFSFTVKTNIKRITFMRNLSMVTACMRFCNILII